MNTPYPTAHINAKPEDFAKTVLMPGDPLRSKFIAENFLTEIKLVNNVRGVQGYTGKYKGKDVSVMASGMGMPSMGIYSYELFNFFDVENIIRVGSAGSINKDVKVRDIVLGMGACTNSSFQNQFRLNISFAPICSYPLLKKCSDIADKLKIAYHVGNLISSDTFYDDDFNLKDEEKNASLWGKMGILAVEMEAAALYMNAARSNKNALAICTISDHLITKEETTAQERENSFTDMIELSLETAISL